MDHIAVPIPEGMDEAQKADLAAWLSKQAEQFIAGRLPIEDDPAFRTEAVAKIKKGMANVEAGRTRPAKQAIRQIADDLGIDLNR